MPAIKSGNDIYIIAPGIDRYSDVVTDINDSAWFEDKGGGTYRLKGPHRIQVRDEGQLQHGDANDFSIQEILEIEPTANNNSGLLVNHGGSFEFYGAGEIKHTINVFYGTWSISGKFFARGNELYRPKISNFNNLFFTYQATNSADFIHDIWDVAKIDIENAFNTSATGLYIILYSLSPSHSFVDIVCDAKVGALPGQYNGLYGIYSINNYSDTCDKIVIDNCIFRNFNTYGARLINSNLVLKDCTLEGNRLFGMEINYIPWLPELNHSQKTGKYGSKGQTFYIFDGVLFTNNYITSQRSLLITGSTLLLKNNTFNETNVNIVASPSLVFIWTGNIFNASNPFERRLNNAIFDVRALNLTVTDTNDIPIKGACITVIQKDNKETWAFTTDINGKPLTMDYLENKIILVWSERIDPLPNTYDFWSDDSNDTYHIIEVSTFGYITQQIPIVMDQDRDLTIKLQIGATPSPVLAKVLELDSRYM